MLLSQLVLIAAALFTGAAFYVSVAEHLARLQLDDRAVLAQWKPPTRTAADQQHAQGTDPAQAGPQTPALFGK